MKNCIRFIDLAEAAGITLDSATKPKGGKSRGAMLLEAAGLKLPQMHTPTPKSAKKRTLSGETPASKQAAAELPGSLAILKDILGKLLVCSRRLPSAAQLLHCAAA